MTAFHLLHGFKHPTQPILITGQTELIAGTFDAEFGRRDHRLLGSHQGKLIQVIVGVDVTILSVINLPDWQGWIGAKDLFQSLSDLAVVRKGIADVHFRGDWFGGEAGLWV
jgi:hypothetical protein